jgi:GxxExxY protein
MTPRRTAFGHEHTYAVIGAFYDVYNRFGFGLLESVYAAALVQEIEGRGLFVDRELWVDVFYKGQRIGKQRIDIVVNHSLIVEVKATEFLPPFSRRQVLTYLRATELELALILHFGPRPRAYRLIDTEKDRTQISAG